MNNQRRKNIKAIIDKIENQLRALCEELQQDIEVLMDEEQCAFDNIPENLQGADRYISMEEAVDNLVSAYNFFDDEMDLSQLTTYLEDAMK